jgi:branched-chain amino acid transport system substrate-binding protein
VQEAYTFSPNPKGNAKDKWDLITLGAAVPAANEPMEDLNPTKEQNPCSL